MDAEQHARWLTSRYWSSGGLESSERAGRGMMTYDETYLQTR
jgi:hypothetical protein